MWESPVKSQPAVFQTHVKITGLFLSSGRSITDGTAVNREQILGEQNVNFILQRTLRAGNTGLWSLSSEDARLLWTGFFFLTFQTSNKNGWNQSNCHFSLSCDPRRSLT